MSFKTKDLLYLLLFALVVRGIYSYYNLNLGGDAIRYTAMALSIWYEGVFSTYFHHIDIPRLFFIIFLSPWVSLSYLITKDAFLASGIPPFLFGITIVLIIYQICIKLYNRKTAIWAGILAVIFPPMVYQSSILLPEIFYIFCICCGILFTVYFFDKRTLTRIFASSIFFVMAARMHAEGNLVFLIFVFYILHDSYKLKNSSSSTKINLFLMAGVMCAVFLAIILLETFFATQILNIPRSSYKQLIGLSLGKLVVKMQTLFLVKTPGGFLQSNPIEYTLQNLHLVWYSALAICYDMLKTIFLVPLRVVPPLLLIMLGFAFNTKNMHEKEKRIETFLLLILPSLLIFPVLFISHSRYLALLIPVSIIFLAKGINRFSEILIDRFRDEKWINIVLFFTIFLYLMMYLLPDLVGKSQVPAWRQQLTIVAEWINQNVSDKKMKLLSYNAHNLGIMTKRAMLVYEEHSKRIDSVWVSLPTTGTSRIDSIVNSCGKVLLVFVKRKAADPLEVARNIYFFNLKRSMGSYLIDDSPSFERMIAPGDLSDPNAVDVKESLYVPDNSILLKKFSFERPPSEWFIYECRGTS